MIANGTPVLDMTIASSRRSAETAIADFSAKVQRGSVSDAIQWNGVEAMVAEQVIGLLDRFEEIREEDDLDRALAYAAHRSADAERNQGWFDPTSQSSSAAATLVDQTAFKAQRTIVELAADLHKAAGMDADER